MLFSPPSIPTHGFPFTILLTSTASQIWLARCNRRFQNKITHHTALLHLILDIFFIYCLSHFHSLNQADKNKISIKVWKKYILHVCQEGACLVLLFKSVLIHELVFNYASFMVLKPSWLVSHMSLHVVYVSIENVFS